MNEKETMFGRIITALSASPASIMLIIGVLAGVGAVTSYGIITQTSVFRPDPYRGSQGLYEQEARIAGDAALEVGIANLLESSRVRIDRLSKELDTLRAEVKRIEQLQIVRTIMASEQQIKIDRLILEQKEAK